MTVNNATPSKRPWAAPVELRNDTVIESGKYSGAGRVIARVPFKFAEDRANAELIVTAVNAHDALMAVYEAAKAYSDMGFPRAGLSAEGMRLRVRQALAAVDAVIGEVILD
jgi:hypothetical protein